MKTATTLTLIIIICMMFFFDFLSETPIVIIDREDGRETLQTFGIPEIIFVDKEQYEESSTMQASVEELKNHLQDALGNEIYIETVNSNHKGRIIFITPSSNHIADYLSDEEIKSLDEIGEQGYLIIPKRPNIIIAAKDDVGILYGSYTFLEELGFSWVSPDYTVVPEIDDTYVHDWVKLIDEPMYKYRGFWNYKEPSLKFIKWAVRNKYNLIGEVKPAIAEKYGINIWTGGHHLLYDFLNNEELYSSNPELYGMKNGERIFVGDNSELYMNPSFENKDLAKMFSQFLIDKYKLYGFSGKLFINIWPSDASSNAYFSHSKESKEIGNSTDNLLYFYKNLINELKENNTLDFDIVVNGITYYSTWDLPQNDYRLDNKNFRQILYLNERSFSNTISLDEFKAGIESWNKYSEKNNLKLGVVEYYNFSIYGGTLSDYSQVIYDDIRYYSNKNIDLFAYMHPLEGSNGTFDLLNYSLSKLLWNPSTSKENIEDKYFNSLYQDKAMELKKIYKKIDQALSNRKEMLGQNSLRYCLFQEVYWAVPPYSSEEVNDHINKFLIGGKQELPAKFQSSKEFISADFLGLRDSIKLLESSLKDLELLQVKELSQPTINKINNDIKWTKASLNIYKLLNNLSILRLYEENNLSIDIGKLVNETKIIVDDLQNNDVFFKTVSKVDQLRIINHLKSEKMIIPDQLRIALSK